MAVLKKRKRTTLSDKARNAVLVIIAIITVIIFFNLDLMEKGDSLFSRTAESKLNFKGDLKRKAYKPEEYDRLLVFIKKHQAIIETATIQTSVDRGYGKLTPSSQILFEVRFQLTDGGMISTPTRRTTREKLVSAILIKMKKDMKAYKGLQKKGKKVKSLVNTM